MTTTEEAERSVIGAALLDAGSLRLTSEHIDANDFGDKRLGQVYKLLTDLHATGHPIDPVTVAGAARTQRMAWCDGVMLYELQASTPTASNAAYYAKIVREAAIRRRMEMAGLRLTQLSQATDPLEEVMGHARGEWESIRGSAAGTLTTKRLAELLEGTDEYDWLIPGLIERHDRWVLTGGEGGGKSTLFRQVAILAAAGIHPFLLTPITPVKVLVVDVENTEGQWRREVRRTVTNAQLQGTADPAELSIVCMDGLPGGRLDLTTERDLGAVHRLIDQHEPDMLLIGPLYKLIPRAITSDDDAAPLITNLDSLRARGVALLMEAHAGHGKTASGNRDLRPRGSAALMGWPEFGLGLTTDPEDTSGCTSKLIPWRGGRDGERAFPDRLVRAAKGERQAWPWMTEENARSPWTPRYPGDPN